MTESMKIGILMLASYLLGSLPFGLWIAFRYTGKDIRTLGSGNIGATNVTRVCGRTAGVIVFVLDVLKGLIPPLIAADVLHLNSSWQIAAALCAIIGHNYSIWLRFSGGKGIATSLGALIGVAPLVGLAAFVLWGVVVLASGWVSLGSILAALSLPIFMLLFHPGDHAKLLFGIVACLLAVYKHRANVGRLRTGREPKVGLPWFARSAASSHSTSDVQPDAPTSSENNATAQH